MRGIDAVLQELPGGIYDIQIDWEGDIQTADSFDTFILVALLTDARADESEVLDDSKRRGWIGNEHTPGFQMGSKLWLYEQSRLTRTVMNDINGVALDALQSLVNDGLAVSVQSAEMRLTDEGIFLELVILKPQSQVEHRLFELWANTGVS